MQISSQRIQSAALPPTSTPARAAAGASAATSVSTAGPAQDAGPAAVAPQGDNRSTSLARLDGFTEGVMARLEMASKDAPRGEFGAFAEAAESLQSGLSRLRAGIENGTLQPEDIQRGVGNAFQGAREILEAGRKAGGDDASVAKAAQDSSAGSEAIDVGATVRGRFAGFAESVMGRIEAAQGTNRANGAAVSEAAAAFESATARLDAALFDPQTGDPIDRGTFKTLFSEALSSLQSQLTELLGGQGSPSGVIYDAKSAAQGLVAPLRSIDVAG